MTLTLVKLPVFRIGAFLLTALMLPGARLTLGVGLARATTTSNLVGVWPPCR